MCTNVLLHLVTTTPGTVYVFIVPVMEMQRRRRVFAGGHRMSAGEPGLDAAILALRWL